MPECTCKECRDCCKNQPGWFMPGEAEKAAELLNMTFEDFLQQFLIIDYWVSYPDILVLAPVKKESIKQAGRLASLSYTFNTGTCIFLDENERCKIHAAKPLECAKTMGCENEDGNRRFPIKEAWDTPENQEALSKYI